MNSGRSNNLSLKYQMFTLSGCRDIGFRNFEFVIKTQFLYRVAFSLKTHSPIKKKKLMIYLSNRDRKWQLAETMNNFLLYLELVSRFILMQQNWFYVEITPLPCQLHSFIKYLLEYTALPGSTFSFMVRVTPAVYPRLV